MRIDVHVHSKFSKRPSEWIFKKIGCSESYTEPLNIYRIAKNRGMTHVTISDHNTIDGALEIAHLQKFPARDLHEIIRNEGSLMKDFNPKDESISL